MGAYRYKLQAVVLALLLLPAAGWAGELRDFDGEQRSIQEFTGDGKWLVVMIWAHDCEVCNAEAYRYVDFHTFHKDDDARMLGISIDGKRYSDQARAFIERHNINFPNLIGEPEAVADLYTRLAGRPWLGTPTFLIYDPSGELRAQQVGAVPPRIIEDFIAKNTQG